MTRAAGFEQRGLLDVSPLRIFDLSGRTAVVTGAAGGIGRWLTAGLAASGASVAMVDVDTGGLERLRKELGDFDVACTAHAVDLCAIDPAELLAEVRAEHGGVDILVNCAAVNRRRPIAEVTPGDYDEIMALNLRVPYFLSRAAAQLMAGRGGSIIHVGSINSGYGLADVSVYGAAKAALSQLTRVQAVEWAPLGVRVNCLAPGFMHTPLSEPLWRDSRRADWILSRVAMRRPGHPSELVGQLLVLASDAGSFITGQTYFVDGGFLAGGDWNDGVID